MMCTTWMADVGHVHAGPADPRPCQSWVLASSCSRLGHLRPKDGMKLKQGGSAQPDSTTTRAGRLQGFQRDGISQRMARKGERRGKGLSRKGGASCRHTVLEFDTGSWRPSPSHAGPGSQLHP